MSDTPGAGDTLHDWKRQVDGECWCGTGKCIETLGQYYCWKTLPGLGWGILLRSKEESPSSDWVGTADPTSGQLYGLVSAEQ